MFPFAKLFSILLQPEGIICAITELLIRNWIMTTLLMQMLKF